MKNNNQTVKAFATILLLAIVIFLLQCKCSPETTGEAGHKRSSDDRYIVAAYYWPSLHDEPRSREVFWGEGIGEWEMVKKAKPRFKGHYQPRVPWTV